MRWLRRTDNGHGNVKVKIICEGTHVGLDYEGPPPDWALLTQLIGALAGRPSGPTAFSPRVITLSDEASPAAPVAADASPMLPQLQRQLQLEAASPNLQTAEGGCRARAHC
jgi:hypothetical protein